jgi:DNA-directed RNA polymerase I, II, and III subunit RPABC1
MLQKIRETVLEMFEQRGYTDFEETETDIVALKPDGNQVCAFIKIIPKMNLDEIHSHISLLKDSEIKHFILIHENKPTSNVVTCIATLANIDKQIELFKSIDLLINITKHRLVPKHSAVENPEKLIKLAKNLPIMKSTDQIARFYNFLPGTIVKVERPNCICYRIVR